MIRGTRGETIFYLTSFNSNTENKHMVPDLTVSQSLRKSTPASLWNIQYKWMNGSVKQREREREREREGCDVCPQ